MEIEIVPRPKNSYGYSINCNICDKHPDEPIATTCGHIFCWPCYYLASPCKSAIQCYKCYTDLYFLEIACLKLRGTDERTKYKYVNGKKIPPRPSTIKDINKRKKMKRKTQAEEDREIVFNIHIIQQKSTLILWFFSFVIGNYVLYKYTSVFPFIYYILGIIFSL